MREVLLGALEPKHQFDQLLLAEPLQITSIHPAMDSEIASLGKGVGNCVRIAPSFDYFLHCARTCYYSLSPIAIGDFVRSVRNLVYLARRYFRLRRR